ncbi:hypothetical protein NQ318_011235 [Aromia moschata]|uniref:ZAD domain-containing protein n=1 Tax=Aromia moschata TaxID=1265417 RepID=A0AAV8YIS0_9CUCU|nr:hypothetical protein NQ318_011235 [Aromia moschata]
MANKAICRTCLKKTSSDFCKRMGPEEENDETCNILEKLNYCVPELDINLVIDPVICNDCLKLLDIAYKFKTECLKNEEKLLKFSHSTNSRVDINYFCKNVQPTVHKKRLIETQTVKVVEVTSEGNKVGNINDELNANMSKKRPFGCENCYGCQKKKLTIQVTMRKTTRPHLSATIAAKI